MPLPIFCRANAPALFRIVPPKVLVALLLPTVSVGLPPATVSTVPLPERLLVAGHSVRDGWELGPANQ